MGLFDRLFKKWWRAKYSPYQESLEEVRKALLTLVTHIQQGNTLAAESICEWLLGQLAELSTSASDHGQYVQLADGYFRLGIHLRQLKHDDQAERAYQSALRISTSASSVPDLNWASKQMAACHNHLGLLYLDAQSFQQCARSFGEALSLRESLRDSDPEDEENLVCLGGVLCNLGNLALTNDKLETALDLYYRSIEILDSSIPGCDCGCRDMTENMRSMIMGQPSPIVLGQQFLNNALKGRAAVLAKQFPDQRYRHIHCFQRGAITIASIATERIVASSSTALADDEMLRELKIELLDAIGFAPGSVVIDLQAVKDIDAAGAAVLLHLRGRLVGRGEWPSLCSLSDELRAATPEILWGELFNCYPTVDDVLDLETKK